MSYRIALVLAALTAACGPSSGDDTAGGPDAMPGAVDYDGDGFSGIEDCDETNPEIHAGATEVCNGMDDDCSGAADEPYDADGDGSATCLGDCDDANPDVRPGFPEACDGADTDCNPLTDEHADADLDGYTICTGECDDEEPFVNPGAIEVQLNEEGAAEMVDNDCDGDVDEALDPCDSGLSPSDPMSYAKAIELCQGVTTAGFNTTANSLARAIRTNFGATYAPHYGASMVVLSSGVAADANDPGYVYPDPGTEFFNTAAHPDPQPDPADGCGSADPTIVNDYVELRLRIQAPTNAKSFSYDFNFMSAEYPEWVCSMFDDTFIAYLESAAYTGNISFDAMGRPVTINIGFFTVCDGGAGCTGSGPLSGTGHEAGNGGGTGWLTTTAPVEPGEELVLSFMIFDEGDSILDSSVLIDNFRWELEPVDAPITIDRPGPDGRRP